MSWFPEALVAKAKHFSQIALQQSDMAQASLLNSFAVELLCRACLANVSPYLLASSHDRTNGAVYIKNGSGSPRSLDSSDVIKQCKALIPSFDKVAPHVELLAAARNADLHSGERPWAKPENQRLRILSYVVIGVCLEILAVDMDEFFGVQADTAREYIDDYTSSISVAWGKLLHEARGRYARLSREEVERQFALINIYNYESLDVSRRACPACSHPGVMTFRDRMIAASFDSETGYVEKQLHRTPVSFQCQVCGLRIGSHLLCEVGMGAVEVFELEMSAVDSLTREQAIEQFGERFENTELLSFEQRELLMEGIAMRNYHDDLDYNSRRNK